MSCVWCGGGGVRCVLSVVYVRWGGQSKARQERIGGNNEAKHLNNEQKWRQLEAGHLVKIA